MGEVEADRLFWYCIPQSQGHGGTRHLQIGRCWHHPKTVDHMIAQEKLVTVKGRTELLLPKRGGVTLHQRRRRWCQRMQRGVTCEHGPWISRSPNLRCRDGWNWWTCPYGWGGDPIAFAGKWVSWQRDARILFARK